MKKVFFISIIVLLLFVSCAKNHDTLTVYCYDSFLGSWGAGEKIAGSFTEKTGIKVELIGCGSASELNSRLVFEGDDCKADIILGLEGGNITNPSAFSRLEEFDYGILAFVYDTQSSVKPPESLLELTSDCYKDKVILVDPRTSSVGLGLLKWSYNALGEKSMDWWHKMADNALTVSSSWSAAYGIFTEGEAPLVISYTTSPVYHVLNENSDRYVALQFNDGHVKTSEYAGVLKTSRLKEDADKFLDYILNEGQAEIAVCNTMFPANAETVLPAAFEIAITPPLIPDNGYFDSHRAEILKQWTDAVSR